jgi:hypothetical protein
VNSGFPLLAGSVTLRPTRSSTQVVLSFDSSLVLRQLRPRGEQGRANWGRYASVRWLGVGALWQWWQIP